MRTPNVRYVAEGSGDDLFALDEIHASNKVGEFITHTDNAGVIVDYKVEKVTMAIVSVDPPHPFYEGDLVSITETVVELSVVP